MKNLCEYLEILGVDAPEKLYQGCGSAYTGTTEDVAAELRVLERSGEWVAEPKYDGIWAAVFGRGPNQAPLVLSRNGKEKKGHDLCAIPEGLVLVGELAYGSQHSTKIREEAGHGVVFIFDCLVADGECIVELPRAERKKRAAVSLKQYWADCSRGRHYYRMAPTWSKGGDFVKLYDESHEGLLLKPAVGKPYQYGTRVAHWMKFKKKETFDVVVVGVEISTAETKVGEPMASAIVVGLYKRPSSVKAPLIHGVGNAPARVSRNGGVLVLTSVGKVAGMTDDFCRELAQNFDAYKGRVMEVAAFDQFKSGAFRHPSVVRMREDKSPEECVFEGRAMALAE